MRTMVRFGLRMNFSSVSAAEQAPAREISSCFPWAFPHGVPPSGGLRAALPSGFAARLCSTLLVLLVWLPSLRAAEPVTRISLSQQFVVRGVPIDTPLAIRPSLGSDQMNLEPATAVVSCERIKEQVLRELGAADQWKGKIYLRLHPRLSDEERVMVDAQSRAEGWVYFVDMPALISRRRFLNSMVQIILFEWANRGAQTVPSELPPWLGEGLAGLLETRGILSLFAEPFSRRIEIQRWEVAALELRKRFQATPPLSFDQLSWPLKNPDAAQADHYRASAHLLVAELLRMENGPGNLVGLLQGLHQNLNWQTTFLRAFGTRFSRLVDVEKWWTVAVMHFLGLDESRRMAPEDVLGQLHEILIVPLDVQVNTNRILNAARATLQQIIPEWEVHRLDPVLYRKIAQLEGLQWRSPQPVSGLVANYRAVLLDFIARRNAASGTTRSRNEVLPNAKIVQNKVIQSLTLLDQERVRLAASLQPATTSDKPVGSTNGVAGPPRSP